VWKLAIADLQHAADLFGPIHDRTAGIEGWVSRGLDRHWRAWL
jgi:hypothetical protein